MGNYAYLVCSDYRGIYPIDRHDKFDCARDILACDKDYVPLLWLALFRTSDLKQARITDLPASASVAPHARIGDVEANVYAALPVLQDIFPSLGRLADLAKSLLGYVLDHGGRHVSLEWHEVAALYNGREFLDFVGRALTYLDAPDGERERAEHQRELRGALSRTDRIRALRGQFRSLSLSDAARVLKDAGDDLERALSTLRRGKNCLELDLEATEVLPPGFDDASIHQVFECLTGIRPDETLPGLDSEGRAIDATWNLARVVGTRSQRVPPWEAT